MEAPVVKSTLDACDECGHRMGDHQYIVGCQHLEPVYSELGYLQRHDKCKCKTSVVGWPGIPHGCVALCRTTFRRAESTEVYPTLTFK
jgi:hypothetical protein